MNRKKRIPLTITIPLLIMTVVYFLIPTISKYAVKSMLPNNIQLLEWDMEFLSFNNLCINHALFKINLDTTENRLSVQNACVTHFSRNINISKIRTKTKALPDNQVETQDFQISPLNTSLFFLPKIDLTLIEQLKKFGSLSINTIYSEYSTLENNIVLDIKKIEASHLLENNNEDNQNFKFSIKNIIISKKEEKKRKYSIFSGQLNLKANSEIVELSLSDLNGKNIADFEFNQTSSQRALELTIKPQFMAHQFKFLIPEFELNYPLSEPLHIEIIRNFNFDTKNIDTQNISLSISLKNPKNEKLNNQIKFKLDMAINNDSEKNQLSLQVATELNGKDITFKQSEDNGSIQIIFDRLTSNTNVKFDTSSNKIKSINDLNNVINIDQLNIIKIDNTIEKDQSTLDFSHLKISLNNDKKLPINPIESIFNNISIHGKLTGNSFKSNINSNKLEIKIGKTDFYDAPSLNLNFSLDKQGDLYHSSGMVQISDFLSDTFMINNNKTENIKTTLKLIFEWNNLSASLDPKIKQHKAIVHSSKLELQIEGTDLTSSKLDLPEFIFRSNGEINDNKLVASGNFDISDQRFTSINLINNNIFSKDNIFALDIKNTKMQYELVNQLVASILSKIDSKNEHNLSINKGYIEHNNSIKINEKFHLKSNLELHQFDIDIDSIFLIDLNYKQNIRSLEPLNLFAHLNITEATFASGLLLSNISSEIELHGNKSKLKLSENEQDQLLNISISNLKANIWNGSIQSDSIIVENGVLKPSSIDLKNIDLTELIFFLDMNGLYADGNMDIHLPVEQQNKKYIVENGHFSSNRPGILKYDSGQEQVDVEANIALHALQNFHYDKLDGKINYDKNGAYKIKLHLLGSNPSLYDGYPIDFDLNLNGELSDVFQSMFLTGDFEKSIIERAKMNKLNQ